MQHIELIALMKSLGYKADWEGVCYGVSIMAKQAIVTGKFDYFLQMMSYIEGHKGDLTNKISEAHEELKNKALIPSRANTAFNKLSETEKVLECESFLYGVEAFFNARDYADLLGGQFSQVHWDKFSDILQSDRLEEMGGFSKIYDQSGIYSLDELQDYLTNIGNIIKKHGNISIGLNNGGHAITLSHINDAWVLVDPNNLPAISISEDELAKTIYNALNQRPLTTIIDRAKDANICLHVSLATTNKYLMARTESNDNNSPADAASNESNKALSMDRNAQVLKNDLEVLNRLTAHQINMERVMLSDSTTNMTLLHLAAIHGEAGLVNDLMESGANLNAIDSSGRVPLSLASLYEENDVAKQLLANGADLTIQTSGGNLPIHYAIYANQVELVNIMLAELSDLNIGYQKGYAPLQLASMAGSKEVADLILEKKVSIDKASSSGMTALLYAAKHGHLDMVRTLLENGADINACNDQNESALHLAIKNGHSKAAELLLDYQPVLHVSSTSQQTPLSIAQRVGDKSSEALLLAQTRSLAKSESLMPEIKQPYNSMQIQSIQQQTKQLMESLNLQRADLSKGDDYRYLQLQAKGRLLANQVPLKILAFIHHIEMIQQIVNQVVCKVFDSDEYNKEIAQYSEFLSWLQNKLNETAKKWRTAQDDFNELMQTVVVESDPTKLARKITEISSSGSEWINEQLSEWESYLAQENGFALMQMHHPEAIEQWMNCKKWNQAVFEDVDQSKTQELASTEFLQKHLSSCFNPNAIEVKQTPNQ